MLEIALSLWALIYLKTVIGNCISYWQTKRAVCKLAVFASAYKHSGIPPEKEVYMSDLTALLRYYPAIKRLVSTPELSYSQTDKENFESARSLYHTLQMQQNEAWHTLVLSLNPLNRLRDLILFPITVLHWLGFQPQKWISAFLASVGWLTSYLLEMFQPEIKALLIMLYEKLISG